MAILLREDQKDQTAVFRPAAAKNKKRQNWIWFFLSLIGNCRSLKSANITNMISWWNAEEARNRKLDFSDFRWSN